MSRRTTVPVQLGGQSAKGDPARKPGKAIKVKNLFVRPFRLEKRPGWLRDTNSTGQACGHFLPFISGSDSVTLHGRFGSAGAGKIMKRGSSSTWSITSTLDDVGSGGYIGYYNGDGYLNYSADGVNFYVGKVNGSTFTANAIAETLGGFADCTGFLDRIFIGYVVETVNNLAEPNISNDFATGPGTYWTLSSVTQSSGSLTWTAAAGTAVSANFSAVSSAGEWRTFSVTFKNTTADATLPGYLTLSIENTAGTVTYAKEEIVVLSRSAYPEWQRFNVTALIPASTAYRLRIAGGHVERANNLVTLACADTSNDKGVMVTEGRFIHTVDVAGAVQNPKPTYNFPNRIYWSEPANPLEWRATGYVDLNEEPGAITATRATEDRFYAFKKKAIWLFRGSANPDLPLQRENVIRGVGALNSKSVKMFEGAFYFVGETDVYRMGLGGDVEPLAGEMREALFPVTSNDTCLEIDSDRKQLWVHTQTGKIHIMDLATGAWSYVTLTGAADAELKVQDLWYGQPSTESNREMYAACFYTESNDIVKLRAAQTQDNITGSARDVVAEYTFAPLQLTPPRQIVLLEDLAFYHDITATQTATTTTWQVSLDNGSTFGKTNQVTVAPLSGAAGAVDSIFVPLWQSGPRLVVNLKHSGLAGPTYFNLSGAEATIQVLGGEIEESLPTQGSASL